MPRANPDTHRRPSRAHTAKVPRAGTRETSAGAWLCQGRPKAPGFGLGLSHPLQTLRNISCSALAKSPGRPELFSQTARLRTGDEREKQAHGRCPPWQRESRGYGTGKVRLPLGKPRWQTHRPLPGLPTRFRAFVPVLGGYTVAPSTSKLLKARKGNKSTHGLEPPREADAHSAGLPGGASPTAAAEGADRLAGGGSPSREAGRRVEPSGGLHEPRGEMDPGGGGLGAPTPTARALVAEWPPARRNAALAHAHQLADFGFPAAVGGQAGPGRGRAAKLSGKGPTHPRLRGSCSSAPGQRSCGRVRMPPQPAAREHCLRLPRGSPFRHRGCSLRPLPPRLPLPRPASAASSEAAAAASPRRSAPPRRRRAP